MTASSKFLSLKLYVLDIKYYTLEAGLFVDDNTVSNIGLNGIIAEMLLMVYASTFNTRVAFIY